MLQFMCLFMNQLELQNVNERDPCIQINTFCLLENGILALIIQKETAAEDNNSVVVTDLAKQGK